MKAIGYLLAGAALFSGLADAVQITATDPAAAAILPNGWRYKGCYSDKNWNLGASGLTTPQPYGVPGYPRTLNGYFNRLSTNGGQSCINTCNGLNRGFTFAATNDNQCWCDTALAINGTNAVPPGTPPAWGTADPDNSRCNYGCRGNTGEACGNNTADANGQRLSLYEFVVSGFRNNACVLKLKPLFLFFLFCFGSAPLDDTRRASNEGHGGGEGTIGGGQERRNRHTKGQASRFGSKSLGTVDMRWRSARGMARFSGSDLSSHGLKVVVVRASKSNSVHHVPIGTTISQNKRHFPCSSNS